MFYVSQLKIFVIFIFYLILGSFSQAFEKLGEFSYLMKVCFIVQVVCIVLHSSFQFFDAGLETCSGF